MTAAIGVVPQWTVGDRIAKAQDVAGVSVEALASELGVRRQTVGNWRAGRTKPPAYAIRMIAILTGVSYDWLMFGGVGERQARDLADATERYVDLRADYSGEADERGNVRRQGLEPRTRWLVVVGSEEPEEPVNTGYRPMLRVLKPVA